jgi:four helix bundle protein
MKDFRNLKVWEKSHLLVLEVYRVTLAFPREEVYGLTSQLRRSCASIPTNIAEGCGRNGDLEFGRFLQIAFGSANETEYHLLLAHDLGYLKEDDYLNLSRAIVEIKQMLSTLINKLKADRRKLTADC